MLERNICLETPLSFSIREEERQIIRLTEQQFYLLDFLRHNNRAAVSGCAGSGKTLIAVEKAKRLCTENMRTLLLCYNRPLAEYLSSQLSSITNLSIFTYHNLCIKMAEKANLCVPKANDAKFFAETLPELLIQTFEKCQELKFDAIVVDEGQDFEELWWTSLFGVLRDSVRSIFYIFYDDNQKIYNNNDYIPQRFSSLSAINKHKKYKNNI